ncbi:hypothetical protein O6H91_Y038800 [Diphasiastrum complanatum]|nr:hypothetical protein O6H91_Y038800 [Diphasiastrum complanatum]
MGAGIQFIYSSIQTTFPQLFFGFCASGYSRIDLDFCGLVDQSNPVFSREILFALFDRSRLQQGNLKSGSIFMALQLSTALTFRPIGRRANPKAFLVQRNVVAQYADLKAIQARGGIGSREKLTYLSSSGNSTSSLIALPLQHHDFFGQLGSGNAFIPRAR